MIVVSKKFFGEKIFPTGDIPSSHGPACRPGSPLSTRLGDLVPKLRPAVVLSGNVQKLPKVAKKGGKGGKLKLRFGLI